MDYDANKPEEAGSTAEDFINNRGDDSAKDEIDPNFDNVENPTQDDLQLDITRYEEIKKAGICPKCGSKIDTFDVGQSSRDDFDITGLRAECSKCNWNLQIDF